MHATVQLRLTPNNDDHLSSYICTLLALYPGMGPGYVMFSISVWCHQSAEVIYQVCRGTGILPHVQVDQTIPFLILFWAGKMLGYDSNSNCWFSLLTSCFERAFMGNMFWNTTMNFLLRQCIIGSYGAWDLHYSWNPLSAQLNVGTCSIYSSLLPVPLPSSPSPSSFPYPQFEDIFSKCYKVGNYLKTDPTFEIVCCQ